MVGGRTLNPINRKFVFSPKVDKNGTDRHLHEEGRDHWLVQLQRPPVVPPPGSNQGSVELIQGGFRRIQSRRLQSIAGNAPA